MDSLQSLVALFSIHLLVLLSYLHFTSSNKTATTFSLKLIHRDSPESPIYPGPMTFRERVERYRKISDSRVSHWKQINMHNRTEQPNIMRPRVTTDDGYLYLVELEMGDPLKTVYVVMDTGSGITWIQCLPCQECSPQKFEIYDPRNSKTFKKIPCNSPICYSFKCIDQQCMYSLHYLGGDSTEGYAASETIHIKDEQGLYTHIADVFFGCSIKTHIASADNSSLETGIMGLDTNPLSFISQLGSFVLRRFSYCLVNPTNSSTPLFSYLKFGDDIGFIGGAVQKTPFTKHPDFPNGYFVNLLDISVDNKRLNFPPDTFTFKPDTGEGGFLIDSGTVLTYIQDTAYSKLEEEIVRYFSPYKDLVRNQDCSPPSKLCYDAPMGFPLFPTITYHFQGANLTIAPENSFEVDYEEKSFILSIAPLPRLSILGAYQQHNIRSIFDIDSNVFAFVPDDCSKDE
ncbi:hypothetical protein Ddye_026890 [Dipteronia dyeriana]|uniref:Peptidase A1 domain-containing protein n=1 Tax=Dipteronia dyeriana TaxID=168575 RepID=A0AAD9TN39_9ROSI|nr:hypothetical protein Ddye_026890 [Dipteronia dyeriana]